MSWEGVTPVSTGRDFFRDALEGPPLPPDETRLRPGRAEATVERSSSVSESTILEFMDSDLLRRGSRELRRLLSAMGERDLSPLPKDDGGSEEPGVEPGAVPGVEPGVEPGPEPGVEPEVASPERLDGGDSGNGVADPSEGVRAGWPPCPSGREPLWDSESSSWSIKGDHRSLVVSKSEAAVSAA